MRWEWEPCQKGLLMGGWNRTTEDTSGRQSQGNTLDSPSSSLQGKPGGKPIYLQESGKQSGNPPPLESRAEHEGDEESGQHALCSGAPPCLISYVCPAS